MWRRCSLVNPSLRRILVKHHLVYVVYTSWKCDKIRAFHCRNPVRSTCFGHMRSSSGIYNCQTATLHSITSLHVKCKRLSKSVFFLVFKRAIATGLNGRGSIPGRDKIFSLLHSVQTVSGDHPASYPMGTGWATFPGVKRLGREADQMPHLVPSLSVASSRHSI
jgi:hypothetical protein